MQLLTNWLAYIIYRMSISIFYYNHYNSSINYITLFIDFNQKIIFPTNLHTNFNFKFIFDSNCWWVIKFKIFNKVNKIIIIIVPK